MIFIRKLFIAITLLLLFFVSFYLTWNSGEVTTNFEAKAIERKKIVALIKSDLLESQQTRKREEVGVTISEIALPQPYKNVTRNDKVTVIEKGDILEIYFQLKTSQFGSSTLYFVYKSDPKLEDKTQLSKEDFLGLNGGRFFKLEKVAPNWYRVCNSH